MRKFLVAALLAAALPAGPAMAASLMGQLQNIEGIVYVNRGAGYVRVQEPTELFQGDRILVDQNSSASFNYYLAGCHVRLAATSVTTISATAPCQASSELPSQGASMGRETVLVVGGVAAAATIGGILLLTTGGGGDNNDNGQSP